MNIDKLNEILLLNTEDEGLKNNGYIESESMKSIVQYIDKISEDILITPFYISKNKEVYELQYMELTVEFTDRDDVLEFSNNANFSAEFKRRFNPKVFVNRNNRKVLKKYIKEYFRNLETFNFKEEFNIKFDGELYFQIY